jgi:hypothetical protein
MMNNIEKIKAILESLNQLALDIESDTGKTPTAFEAIEWIDTALDEIILLENNHIQVDRPQ